MTEEIIKKILEEIIYDEFCTEKTELYSKIAESHFDNYVLHKTDNFLFMKALPQHSGNLCGFYALFFSYCYLRYVLTSFTFANYKPYHI